MSFLFEKGYSQSDFLTFLRNELFKGNFVEEYQKLTPQRKTAFFMDQQLYRIGTVQFDDKEIAILEIKQRSKHDPRITLTQDTFKLMEDYGISDALVALYVDEKSSWRFSLLTTKYDHFKKTTSNPKRYSFIVGPNEKIRTVEQQLIKKGPIKDFEDLVSRFDVEVVRKEFFDTYLELFIRLYKEIKKDSDFLSLLGKEKVDLVSFTKNLLGKIIFLYFIQQKGWLGLGRNTTTKYGEGDKNFMRKLWINFAEQDESLCLHEKTGYFYNDYLEWLFFAGLNVDRRDNDDWFEQLQMKVPFLNGGLFKEEYEGRQNNIAKIDNAIFSNKNDDGILDIFDRYNFTIDEDSLYDTDIAVDPEMLGRIFEKMISISVGNIDKVEEIYNNKKKNAKFDFGKDLNKKFGAFYTPREIVHYMTRESLIAYLQNEVKCEESLIRKLFELKEKFLLQEKDNTQDYQVLGTYIIDIDEALKSVKILDPAIGSGAFPMGLLNEISSLRYYIYGVFHEIFNSQIDDYKTEKHLSLYKIKREIILNNIYGVDIDPGAIDIAKLRFRLSLVVDEENPEPLPNFEFKFVCANSLIPLEEESEEEDDLSKGVNLDTLKKYKRWFYNANGKEEKKELKQKIVNYLNKRNDLFSQKSKQIIEFGANFDNPKHSHSFFDASLMLSESKGFDIVIGNPPYGASLKGEYRENVVAELGQVPDYEIYYYFIEKAKNLLKDDGSLIYIIPNTWLFNTFAEKYRTSLFNNWRILELLDCSKFKIFDTADVRNSIIHFTKNIEDNQNVGYRSTRTALNFHSLISEKRENIDKNDLLKLNQNRSLAFLLSPEEITLVNKIKEKGKPLSYFFPKISQGLIAYDKYRGQAEEIIKSRAYHYNTYHEGLKKRLRGEDVSRYNVSRNGEEWIDYCEGIANPRKPEFFKGKRLLIREITNPTIYATITDEELYNDPAVLIALDNPGYPIEVALGILNSKLASFFHFHYSPKATKGAFPKILIQDLKNFPLAEANDNAIEQIKSNVDKILEVKKNNSDESTQELERQIDKIVYKLYGLTDEEIQIVEESMKS